MTPSIQDLIQFCRQHGTKSLREWPEESLVEYLLHHMRNNSMVFTTDDSGITGLAVGWQCDEANVENHWQKTDPKGKCFYFAQLVARNKEALKRIMYELTVRIPNWQQLRFFARRNDNLREFNLRLLRKLWHKALA